MRVIGGIAKGRRLKAPKSIRPTTDLVKGAIFSILEVEGVKVLDLYAGSGALGIEALSRGASWVDFVEKEPRCCSIIKKNLENTGLSLKAKIFCSPVEKALNFLKGKYDLILLDPPYSSSELPSILEKIASSPLIDENSLVGVLHSRHSPLKSFYLGLKLIEERCYGDTLFSIFRKEKD